MATLKQWISTYEIVRRSADHIELTQEEIADYHQALQDEVASSTPPEAVMLGDLPIQVVTD